VRNIGIHLLLSVNLNFDGASKKNPSTFKARALIKDHEGNIDVFETQFTGLNSNNVDKVEGLNS